MGGQNEYPTKCFVKYLEFIGIPEVRINGSHHIFKTAGMKRSIVVRVNKKMIPELHIATNMQSINKSKHDFIAWMKENC